MFKEVLSKAIGIASNPKAVKAIKIVAKPITLQVKGLVKGGKYVKNKINSNETTKRIFDTAKDKTKSGASKAGSYLYENARKNSRKEFDKMKSRAEKIFSPDSGIYEKVNQDTEGATNLQKALGVRMSKKAGAVVGAGIVAYGITNQMFKNSHENTIKNNSDRDPLANTINHTTSPISAEKSKTSSDKSNSNIANTKELLNKKTGVSNSGADPESVFEAYKLRNGGR